MNKTLPTLFKKNSNGSIQQWTISVKTSPDGNNPFIEKVYGQQGGKLQTSDPDWVMGKNIGKSNETSPYEQALLEAEAQWTKKKTGGKGYVESTNDAEAGVKDELVTGGADPMLAKTYGTIINGDFTADASKKVIFPCFAQPKLNGHRCIATIVDGDVTLWTRTRKPIVSMPHIVEALSTLFSGRTITLDGELYNHSFNEHLEDLSSFIRPEYVKEGSDVVQYHMYDIINDWQTQDKRLDTLSAWKDRNTSDKLVFVPTVRVGGHSQLVGYFEDWRLAGYEGAIIRNTLGVYEGKRSWNLQKLKGWMSKEFAIVGVKEGRGKMAGKAVLECTTDSFDPVAGMLFDCALAATQERRAEIWENKDDYIGKMVSIKFAYYTREGIPFHLVGEAIRDYE